MRYILFSFLILGVVSCKDKDTEAPEVLNFRFNDGGDNITLAVGETVQVQATLVDNMNLKEVKVDIHDNFDGHGHKSLVEDWSEVLIYEVSGNEYNFAQNITVPEYAKSGPYHCNIQVLDETGIESSPQTLKFTVTRTDQPTISLTAPDFSGSYTIGIGDTLKLEGTVNDESDLAKVEVDVTHEDESIEALFEKTYSMSGSTDVSWNFQSDGSVNIPVESGTQTGQYTLRIAAVDSSGNYTIQENIFRVQ